MSLKTLYQIQEVFLSWSHIFAQFTLTYLNTIFFFQSIIIETLWKIMQNKILMLYKLFSLLDSLF